MNASVLVNPETLEVREVDDPTCAPRDALVRPEAIGICGSDVHIFRGHSNWNLDARGAPIPLAVEPQILGHEIVGTVVQLGAKAEGLAVGDRVVLDQGLNCRSLNRDPLCEYCATGFTHHCEHYQEHGITGLPGGFADLISIPAVNAIVIESDIPSESAAMTEPLGCVLHSLNLVQHLGTRYRFEPSSDYEIIQAITICGAGPAGQLFVQAIRSLLGFQGDLFITDPEPRKLAAAAKFGATAIALDGDESVVDAIDRLTDGRRCEVVVDACGAPGAWVDLARILRKQGTAILYGFGRERGKGGTLDALQWQGASLITTCGASGGLEPDGRPSIYLEALDAIESGRIVVDGLITSRYSELEDLEKALGTDPSDPAHLKGVLNRSA